MSVFDNVPSDGPSRPTRRSAGAVARKALVAAGVGFAGALGAAMLDGDLIVAEGIVSAGTGLLAGVATYQVKNARP